jgi:hypothetical protein
LKPPAVSRGNSIPFAALSKKIVSYSENDWRKAAEWSAPLTYPDRLSLDRYSLQRG